MFFYLLLCSIQKNGGFTNFFQENLHFFLKNVGKFGDYVYFCSEIKNLKTR